MFRLALAQAVISAILVFWTVGPVQAQATRTWVSGVGDDFFPCSRTAPCKTFAGAISKTAAGGEITVLDPGGYGSVLITKSISIVAEGTDGSILASGLNGIVVNAGINDVVSLRGLLLEGAGSGLSGVLFLAGKQLNIERCLIRGFRGQAAIDIRTTGSSRTFVSDCTITKNVNGIFVRPASGNNEVFLDSLRIFGNTSQGIRAASPRATVRLNNSAITNNQVGVSVFENGEIISFGSNAIAGNGSDGAPTSTIPLR